MEGQNWESDADVKAELEAMAGFSSIPDSQSPDSSKTRKLKKRKSKVISKKLPKVKETKSTSSVPVKSVNEMELLNVLKQPAFTSDEKYKVLEARDKLIRLKMKKNTDITLAKHIVGTCPDMCPEKERLMREVQHQVSLYEQESGEKVMNPFLAVKQYSRSSADQEVPLPYELRPVTVLQRTMTYLLYKIVDLCDNPDINLGEWYHFLWDRTRGIRKDITQQELCCKGSVELVEQCARFHIHCSARLVAEDPSVFDQKINTENLTKCLQTLKYMYHDLEVKNESCLNEPEFRAYVILLNLNDANFMWEVQKLKTEIQKSKEIQFALHVYSALDKNNYVRFFNLVRSTTYLNACILLRYFVQVRLLALRTLIKSHSPRTPYTQFPLEQLKRILAFEDNASTIDFAEYHGLLLNDSETHIVLDRKTFQIPKFPYSLDRAMNIIESKRQCSVGQIICGKILDYIDFERYIPYDSFDPDGFLNIIEYFPGVDLSAIQKEPEKTTKTEVKDTIDDKPSEIVGKPIFHGSIFAIKSSSESRSNSPMDFVDKGESMLWTKPEKTAGNIFAVKPENISQTTSIFSMPKPDKPVAFPVQPSSSLFANSTPTSSIFAQPPKQSNNKPIQNLDRPAVFTPSVEFSQKPSGSSTSVFHPITTVTEPSRLYNIFAQSKPTGIFPQPTLDTSQRKSGGFTFNLETDPAQSMNITSSFEQQQIKAAQRVDDFQKQKEKVVRMQEELEEKIRVENEKRKRLEMEKRQKKVSVEGQEKHREGIKDDTVRRRLEEEALDRMMKEKMQREKLEAERVAKQKELERKHRKAKEMEERRLAEIKTMEKRRLAEIRNLEKRRLAEIKTMERRRLVEIKNTVSNIMEEVMIKVENKVREDKLKSISQRMKLKQACFYFSKWKNCVLLNKRKRKAIDQWPIWVNSTTVGEEASQLYSKNQEETLKYMKRYRNGLAIDLPVDREITIEKIDLQKLTSYIITRNFGEPHIKSQRIFKGSPSKPQQKFCDLPIRSQRNFLKIDIFIASLSYMTTNLKWIEKIINDLFGWKDNNYELIEEGKMLSHQIKYCIKRKQSYNYESTNGYIFIGDDLSEEFYADIEKILESCKTRSDLPMVILLQNDDYDNEFLDNLISNGKISQCKVIAERYTPKKLASYVENALIYVAEKASKPPPLELDLLKSFLHKYLATEVWKRMSSFTKWNEPYRLCLTNPEVVISLYNEAFSKLESIVFDPNSLEYSDFPEAFQEDFLNEDQPVIPCDFKYFPSFWKNDSYRGKLKRIFSYLTLPRFQTKWPPKDVNELEYMITQFCGRFYRNPSKKVYKIIASILKSFNPVDDFSEIKNILWTDIMEVLVLEKLKEFDFSLREPFVSIYKELFVVYNKRDLAEYNTSTWFYLNNAVVMKEIDCNRYKIEDASEAVIESEDESEVVGIDNAELEAKLLEVAQERYDREEKLNDSKRDLKEFEILMADLEQSMTVQKQINKRFEEILTRTLNE